MKITHSPKTCVTLVSNYSHHREIKSGLTSTISSSTQPSYLFSKDVHIITNLQNYQKHLKILYSIMTKNSFGDFHLFCLIKKQNKTN